MAIAACFLAGYGAVLRLDHFLENRPLWIDEAWRAIYILIRSPLDILFLQHTDPTLAISPIGYMLMTRLSTLLSGPSEMALRQFPLLCGILSLLFWYRFSRQTLQGVGLTAALVLFYCNPSLIYFSAEVKQYSSDVMWVCILYATFVSFQKERAASLSALMVLGVVALFFSQSAVFILAGIVAGLLYASVRTRDQTAAWQALLVGVAWAAMGGFMFMMYYQQMIRSDVFLGYYDAYTLPPLWSAEGWWRVAEGIRTFAGDIGWIYPAWLGLLLAVYGIVRLVREKPDLCIALILPWLLIIAAATLRKYPFHGWYILVLLPSLFIFIAKGLEGVALVRPALRALAWALCLSLAVGPVVHSGTLWVHEHPTQDSRSAIQYIIARHHPGDSIVMSENTKYTFMYYSLFPYRSYPKPVWTGVFGDTVRYHEGFRYVMFHFPNNLHNLALVDNGDLYVRPDKKTKHVSRLWAGRRVWIMSTHTNPDLLSFLNSALVEQGQMLDFYASSATRVYLVQFPPLE